MKFVSPVIRILYTSLVLTLMLCSASAKNSIKWISDYPPLPDSHGFAGSFTGIVVEGEQRWLVNIGGANFPAADPFTDEVAKAWYKNGYKIKLESNSLKPEGEWMSCDSALPTELGYGASVILPKRGTSIFIGGGSVVNGQPVVSDNVYEVSHQGSLKFKPLAKLPADVMHTSAVLLDDHIYVFSGEGEEGAVSQAWAMNTSSEDSAGWKWEAIPWPEKVRPRGFHVMGARDGKVYVFGGRAKSESESSPVATPNTFYGTDDFKDCYAYTPNNENPAKGSWTRIADLPKAISAAPSNAVNVGSSHIMLLGGVHIDLLEHISDTKEDYDLNANLQGLNHPGFTRELWMYHTITDTWVSSEKMPEDVKVPVTATVVTEGNEFLVVSGEWAPKLRTRDSLHGEIVGAKASFGVVNWIVVIGYLLGMVGIGYWFMTREATGSTDDYFRGGQRIPWWVAGLSIFATLLSSITFMAIPALSYASDWNKWIGQWPILLIVPLVVFAYLPFFRKLNVTSAYEYLEARFNLAVRLLASAVFMIFHIGRIAIVLYLPALALSSVTDIDITFAILAIGILCVIYTVIGGIEAVVWTDAIQAVVLVGGALACFFLVATSMDDGFGAINVALSSEEKFISLDWGTFDIGSATKSGWVIFLGFFFAMLPSYTASQDVVQRYVTTSSIKEASRSLWLNIIMSIVGSAIFFALGTALYVFYQANPEKLDPTLASTDGILPFFIMQNLPLGVAGLIIAGVFAAAQSTISSSLNSVAAAFVTDFYKRVIAKDSSDKKQLAVARNVVIILGILGIAVAILIAWSNLKSAFDTFNSFIGLVLGPLAAIFALGIFTKHVNAKACLIGALAGIGGNITVKSMNASGAIDVLPLLNGMICFVITFAVAFIVGFLIKGKSPKIINGLTIYDIHDRK